MQPLACFSPTVRWGGESEEKGKARGLGQRQFDRTAKEENNNNKNSDEKSIQSKKYTVQFSHHQMPSPLPSSNNPPLASSST